MAVLGMGGRSTSILCTGAMREMERLNDANHYLP